MEINFFTLPRTTNLLFAAVIRIIAYAKCSDCARLIFPMVGFYSGSLMSRHKGVDGPCAD